jgi:signal transduction histidine kinase
MRLRTAAVTGVVVLGLLTSTSLVALVTIPTALQRTTVTLSRNLELTRNLNEVGMAVLQHARSHYLFQVTHDETHQAAAAATERAMKGSLEQARSLATHPETLAMVDDVARNLASYLQLQEQPPDPSRTPLDRYLAIQGPRDAILVSTRTHVRKLVDQAHAASSGATRWEEAAARLAVALGGLTVAALVVLLLAGRLSVYRPLTRLTSAMQRFSEGQTSARAGKEGLAELAVMARTFNGMADQLEAQTQRRLEFLAGVAHDLRNPIGVLKMAVGVYDPAQPPEALGKVAGTIGRATERLDRMVGDLLDAAALESGQLRLNRASCDLRAVPQAVADLYRAAQANIELELPAAPVECTVDPQRLEQAIGNLVNNAVKYAPSGSPVRLALAVSGEQVEIRVSDQGPGIPADELGELFQPFHRGQGARQQTKGAGLGLTIAARIVEAHQGRIVVDSQPGKGATFRVLLPEPAAATVPALAAAPPVAATSSR